MTERKNINRGFKKLRVWQDAVSLYILSCKVFADFPFHLKKVVANGLREYLNYLNIALGSCGEFHSCYESFRQAEQISDKQYEELDQIHYKVENGLINLIRSLQKKLRNGEWQETFELE